MEQTPDDRNVAVGLVVKAGHAGIATGRLLVLPLRAFGRLPVAGPPIRRRTDGLAATGADARRRLETAAEEVLATPEAGRAIDHVLAGPLPETLARSLVEQRVVERIVAEVLATADLEATVTATLESERAKELVAQILASPALERLAVDALENRRIVELTDRIVKSAEFEHALAGAMSSPAVRAALARQSASFGSDMAAALRGRATRLDGAAERPPRRWFRRPPRTDVAYGGLATRGIGLAVDAGLTYLIFLSIGAMLGLVASLFGHIRPEWLVALLVGSGWLLTVSIYFVTFWTTTGQTPGMRLMSVRVVTADGAPPGALRSIVRLIGLAVATVIFFLGFVPVLFDDRRRALQDFLAGTTVLYDDHTPPATAEAVPAELRAAHA
jgi:uncharacterized RDD family membrane protein YckC